MANGQNLAMDKISDQNHPTTKVSKSLHRIAPTHNYSPPPLLLKHQPASNPSLPIPAPKNIHILSLKPPIPCLKSRSTSLTPHKGAQSSVSALYPMDPSHLTLPI